MELFRLPGEADPLFFRNLVSNTGHEMAFEPADRGFKKLGFGTKACANRQQIGCNWAAIEGESHCISCAMTIEIPDLAEDENLMLWAEAEAAKRWVLAGLMRWGLFLPGDKVDPPKFRFLSERVTGGSVKVIMGHQSGIVTINVQEADPAIREFRRQQMEERFRTMTGHFRHELGHALFNRLTGIDGFLPAFRALFGDETQDYGAALERYYQRGEKDAGSTDYLTAYASAHPHEDWAETFAHYLHLVDMLDSAQAAGLASAPGGANAYQQTDAKAMLFAAADIGIALNHVNRSMGMSDIYPFIFSQVTIKKLTFVHDWVRRPAASALIR